MENDLRRWMRLVEAHHAYDDIDYKTQFQPFNSGDTVRVFHGFYNLGDAIVTAKVGLSGGERASRNFSYESNNNPKGLFVTLKLKVAEEFALRGPIMEFVAPVSDLEAPVWPGNGYTVQGQMAQYFGGGATGRADRLRRRRELNAEVQQQIARDPEAMAHVAQSDDPYRAYMLSSGREYQALYVGHLEPQAITAFWVSDRPGYRNPNWIRHSREEFLAKHSEVQVKTPDRRVFTPSQAFDPAEFMRVMTSRHRADRVESMLRNSASHIRTSPRPAQQFASYFNDYLWPKQRAAAMAWLVRTYRGVGPDE